MKIRTIFPVILVPILSGILITILLVLHVISLPFIQATAASGRVALASSITSYTSKSQVVSPVASDQQLTLAIGLNLRNQAALTTYLKEVTTPHSALYHQYINQATFTALYGPLPASEESLKAFLRSEGFTITATYPDHLLIDATATAAQVESAFQIVLNNYRAPDGHLFFANASAPSLPEALAPLVATISGLDNLVQYGRKPLFPAVASAIENPLPQKPISCPQAGKTSLPTSYTPDQIATAYDFTSLYTTGMLGEGQIVGLLELDGFSPNDIALYASCFGGKNTSIQTIAIDGFNGMPGINAAEVELDMEMLLGLAPRLAALRVYETSNTSLAAYNDAWAHIINDRVPVVSTSWVFCEEGPGLSNELQQENIFFQAAAAQGQTILAASGDLGASGCSDSQTGANAKLSVDDPASQPFVTGVGGTTLHLNADNSYHSEQVWNDRALKNGASGGGFSQVWPLPFWQKGPGVANANSTGFREVPDVSINADPQTGYDVYCTAGGCADKGWQILGGTSAAAPVWAALVALANESSLKASGLLLGFLNPDLYTISHDASGTSYAAAFHDILPVQGVLNTNDYTDNANAYPTSSGYDLATGLGSFDAYNLVQNLLTLSHGTQSRLAPTSTTWYFAEGRAGGNFQEYLTLANPDPIQMARVQVQYLLEGSTGPAIIHTVPPQSRATVSVNADLNLPYAGPGKSLSMIVTSLNNVGVIAERPMYFTWHGINSGTDALGATKLGQDFYFADVESQRNYSSFITILNPPGNQTANVVVSYFAAGRQLGAITVVVPAGQRGTTIPQVLGITRTAAVQVHSDQPVMVERPMYFSTARSNINGPITGAATVIGTQTPGNDWLFAEGYTGPNFHEYLVLANFDPKVTANVTVKLEYSNGASNPVTLIVAPQSQTFFDVNTASASFGQGTLDVSAEVTSDAPIVAQRQEYFRFNGTMPGGTDIIGQPGPARTTYTFAEGYTANGFSEFLTLQNPTTSSEVVATNQPNTPNTQTQQIVTVGPQTRMTLNINSIVVLCWVCLVVVGYAVSLAVQALSGTIVAERPLYFNYGNTSLGGSDVIGYTG